MDYIGVFGTFGRKTLAIMLICIGDGIRDSLFDDECEFSTTVEIIKAL